MSSGGGGQSTNTVQNTNAFVPPWLEQATQGAVQRAQGIADQPFNPYPGQTFAYADPASNQAYNQVGALQGQFAPQFSTGVNAQAGMAGQVTPLSAQGLQANTDALNQQFQQQVYGPSQGLLGNYANQGPATAQGVAAGAQQMMSPYTQSVIDPAMQLMQQQLAQNLQTIGANANQAGAFGGSRQGVMEGVAQSQAALGAQKYLGDMLNNQWANATGISRDLALQAGRQGYDASNALANLIQGGYTGSQKLGQDILSQNMQYGLQAANQLPGALTSYQNAMLGQSNALNTMGLQYQQNQQNLYNAQKAAWQEPGEFQLQQLQTLLGAVSGIPYSTSNTGFSMDTMPMYSNPWGQAIGGGTALLGGVGSILDRTSAGNA